MSLLEFLKPSNPTVPPPGTSAYKAYLRATGSTPEQGADAYAAQQAVPPPGTSAYKAYEYYQENGRKAPSLFEILGAESDLNNSSSKPYLPSASDLASSPGKKAVLDYLNADLAEYYGMSKSTAYQEALANTSYQRAVQDMRDAGLNPAVMFGSGRAQSSDSSIYAADKRSGGGYSRRYGSRSSGNGKLFSGSAYSAIQAIGGLVGLAATKRPDGFWIGSQTAKGAMGLLDSLWKK